MHAHADGLLQLREAPRYVHQGSPILSSSGRATILGTDEEATTAAIAAATHKTYARNDNAIVEQ